MKYPAPLDRKALYVSVIILLLIVVLAGGMGVYVLSDPGLAEAFVLVRTAIIIDEYYPQKLNWHELISQGREQMFERLDRYSNYVESSQFDWMDEKESGNYSGIGVTVVSHGDGLLIMAVRENGPAARVGLLTGDVIIRADSTDLAGVGFDRAALLLRGQTGSRVQLRVFRVAGGDTLDVNVVREEIAFVHVPYAGYAADSVLYIRVLDFDPGTAHDIKAALDSLLIGRTGQRPPGLVLDLRGNPGGLFAEAYETANLFLEKGTFIVGTDGRSRWMDEEYRATGPDITAGLPMVVLVDRGSASASEIVAGALQRAGRALLVGDTTFGKGLVQGFVRFPDGDGLRLTMSRYYLDGRVYLNEFDSALNDVGHGLVPDRYFKSPDEGYFPQMLENSLVLQEFAERNQDDIVADADSGGLGDNWLERIVEFARRQNFDYHSPLTRQIEDMGEIAKEEEASPAVVAALVALLKTGRDEDWRAFYGHGEYIKRRLRQIAVERKYGVCRSYRDVIAWENPGIVFAANVVRAGH
jgi:carboxyl-terminal processing protease